MMIRQLLIFILLFVVTHSAFNQNPQIEADSLIGLVKTAKDEDLPALYNNIARAHIRLDPFKVVEYAEKALGESIKQKVPESEFKALNNLGIGYAILSDYEKSVDYFLQAIDLAKVTNNPQDYAYALDNLGNVYLYQDKFELALENKQQALRIKEAIKDEAGICTSLTNIATLFDFMGAHEKAISTYKKAILQSKKINDENSLMACYENIAVAYYSLEQIDTTLMYIDSVFIIAEKTNQLNSLSLVYDLLGGIHRKKGEYEKSVEYYLKEISLIENRGDKEKLSNAYNNVGKVYGDLGDYKNAEEYLNRGLKIATEIDSKKRTYEGLYGLATIYENTGRYKQAADFYNRHIVLKDSLVSENINQQIAEMEARFNDEKVQLENQNLKEAKALDEVIIANKEILANEEKFQKKIYAAGLALCAILVVVVLVGFLQKKKANALIQAQKVEVEIQKEMVEEKNKEIFDSINYAKRIQDAILPPTSFVDETLHENFIFYRPKDIVAGDFYWLEKVEDWIIFAAADCTGHGVPGAMVSVVCHNALNRAVREFGILEPAKILDKTRELVIETFERSESDVKDGMDIALCALNRSTSTLLFSGANNSLYVMRNGALTELKSDKQPVGKFEPQRPFTNHIMQVEKNDTLYIFTDGFADQFGGDKGKKFKYQSFKNLLLGAQSKKMKDQLSEITLAFETWKSDFEQVDDVCVIGVRI